MVGDNQWLSTLPLNSNDRFLVRDVNYPASEGTYQYPKIPVFTFGGTDANKFYDPRWLFKPSNYTQLSFKVNESSSQRLQFWLKDTTFYSQLNEIINFVQPNGNTTRIP